MEIFVKLAKRLYAVSLTKINTEVHIFNDIVKTEKFSRSAAYI